MSMDNHAVVIADADGVIRHWSGGAVAAFGHDAADCVGQTLDRIVPPQFRPAHWAGFRRAMAAGTAGIEGQVGPFPVQCADGAIVEAPGRLSLLRLASGQVIGAMVIFG
jgi:PAS domain S-box-containing protein